MRLVQTKAVYSISQLRAKFFQKTCNKQPG
jgi:hypothetical protein